MPLLSRKIILGLAAIGIAATAFASVARHPISPVAEQHQQQWATPVDKRFNLYRMTPSLYRSALPDQNNVATLQAAGIGTVVSFIKDDDKQWLGDTPMHRVNIALHADRVTDADVIRVLHVIERAQTEGAVLMHCKHGRDRTGLMAAMYRMVIQGWSKPEALSEMRSGGYGNPREMEDALGYLEQVDPVAIRAAYRAGQCSTTLFSTCYAREWLQSVLAASR